MTSPLASPRARCSRPPGVACAIKSHDPNHGASWKGHGEVERGRALTKPVPVQTPCRATSAAPAHPFLARWRMIPRSRARNRVLSCRVLLSSCAEALTQAAPRISERWLKVPGLFLPRVARFPPPLRVPCPPLELAPFPGGMNT